MKKEQETAGGKLPGLLKKAACVITKPFFMLTGVISDLIFMYQIRRINERELPAEDREVLNMQESEEDI